MALCSHAADRRVANRRPPSRIGRPLLLGVVRGFYRLYETVVYSGRQFQLRSYGAPGVRRAYDDLHARQAVRAPQVAEGRLLDLPSSLESDQRWDHRLRVRRLPFSHAAADAAYQGPSAGVYTVSRRTQRSQAGAGHGCGRRALPGLPRAQPKNSWFGARPQVEERPSAQAGMLQVPLPPRGAWELRPGGKSADRDSDETLRASEHDGRDIEGARSRVLMPHVPSSASGATAQAEQL